MDAHTFRHRYGSVGLVLGASEGIGEAFSRSLAARGLDLVLAARREAPLEKLAAELHAAHAVKVETVCLDLADPALGRALEALADAHPIGLLAYNAAYTAVGPFLERSLDEHLRELAVNVHGPMIAAHVLGRRMAARGRGGIVIMSSASSLAGTELVANYAATKAYDAVLAEGLWAELGRAGVDVVASMAGATRTPTYVASTKKVASNPLARPMEAGPVAEDALAALGKVPVTVPGATNRFAAALLRRVLPRKAAIGLISNATREMYGA